MPIAIEVVLKINGWFFVNEIALVQGAVVKTGRSFLIEDIKDFVVCLAPLFLYFLEVMLNQ